MNCKFINVLAFAAGAAIGSVVTWKFVKNKYDQIIQEEIDSIKETFADIYSDAQNDETEEETSDTNESSVVSEGQISWDELEDLDEEDDEPDENLNEYARVVKKYTYEKGGPEKMANNIVKQPYVIAPYDFGELDDYSTFELTYYADGVLEDEDYNIVNDVKDLLGPKALTTFGEYEDDAVFVRNEELQADFQILKDYRTYAEARSIGPNQVDD